MGVAVDTDRSFDYTMTATVTEVGKMDYLTDTLETSDVFTFKREHISFPNKFINLPIVEFLVDANKAVKHAAVMGSATTVVTKTVTIPVNVLPEYTLMDLLSDIGGFIVILMFVFGFVAMLLTRNRLNDYLVKSLFKMQRQKLQLDHENATPMYVEGGVLSKEAMDHGREKLAKETNIIEIIKNQRYFAAALKFLLTPVQRDLIKEHTKVASIS